MSTELKTMVKVIIDGKENNISFGELLDLLDSEASGLYKCYLDDNLTKSQRMAIRSKHSYQHTYRLTDSLMKVFYRVIVSGSDLNDYYNIPYVRWLLCYLKSSYSSMPSYGSSKKRENYTKRCSGTELIEASLYQVVNSFISKSCCLSTKGKNGYTGNNFLFRVNDLNFNSLHEYIDWFKTRPGYSKWEHERHNTRGTSKVNFVVPKSSDGWYRVSNGYFV